MTSQGRRVLRMLCKFGLLVCLPITGFIWALPADTHVMGGAVTLTVVSIVLGFGAELLAASNESEFQTLSAQYAADSQRRAEALAERDEKLRQYDRIAALLTEQNNSFRAKLITLQVDMQRRRGTGLKADVQTPAIEELPPDLLNVARSR